MKDFIIVGTFTNMTKSYMIDDIANGITHICKRHKQYCIGHRIYFVVKSALNPNHIVHCIWYSTYLKNDVRHYDLVEYNQDKYLNYKDNSIINVDALEDIPDYDGIMGVPISILVYPQEQFKILGKASNTTVIENGEEKNKFERILIKKL